VPDKSPYSFSKGGGLWYGLFCNILISFWILFFIPDLPAFLHPFDLEMNR
jgi:hypothetical protein